MGSLSLLQGIFPTQGLNPGLPHCRRILYHLSHQGSPSESVCIYPLPLEPSSHPSIPPFYVITEGPWFLVALGFCFCPTRGSGVDGKQSQFWPPVKQLITLNLLRGCSWLPPSGHAQLWVSPCLLCPVSYLGVVSEGPQRIAE